jgi:hypothetical protein
MLLWLLALACHTPPREVPIGEVSLGWRLAPGMELTYHLRTTHVVGSDTVLRDELWHYLVRRVDDRGTYSLEGRLEALDASIVSDGVPLDPAALAPAIDEELARLEPISLSLSLDGRMDQLEAGSWSDALPHRLLALRLPSEPVQAGSRWNDAETARSFTSLIPAARDLDVAGTHRLEELRWHRGSRRPWAARGELVAVVSTEAMVRPDDARFPTLDIQGSTSWDLEAGRLLQRSLFICERGGTDPDQSGSLQIEMEWVDPSGVRRR